MAVVGHRVRRLGLLGAGALDAHLLSGDSSANLFEQLEVDYTEVHDDRPPRRVNDASPEDAFAGAPATFRLVFEAGFAGSDSPSHHAHGVMFDPGTGVATADNPLPAGTRLQNFLVKAIATADDEGVTTRREHWTRVHVHAAVERFWLTPDPLTIHLASDAASMLTALVQFDDGVIADITEMGDTVDRWDGRVTWQSNRPTTVRVSATGELEAGAQGDATITATLQPPGGGAAMTAEANVVVAAPWADGAEVALRAGDAARRDRVPNVLFLAEGFTSGEKNTFDYLVTTILDGLGKNRLVDPWPMLHGSVNFWTAFTPGQGAGVTLRSEIWAPSLASPNRRWNPMPEPEAPQPLSDDWTLENLVYEIGLPVPADAGASLNDLLPLLQQRFGADVTEARVRDSFEEWLRLANRGFANEVDSALFLVVGSRPRSAGRAGDGHRSFEFDERRVARSDIQSFLAGMRHARSTIGADLWGPRGKDRAFVCLLTRAPLRSAATRDVSVVSLGRGESGMVTRITRRADGQIEMTPVELPSEDDDLDWLVYLFAHESGHSFGLGDEYGDEETFSDPDTDEIEENPNLHAAATLTTNGQIDGSRIKWGTWLRITAAAPLAGRPVLEGGGTRARLPVPAGAAARFSVDDRVRVRRRLLLRDDENRLVYRRPVQTGVLKVIERPSGEELVVEADGAPAAGETPLAELEATFLIDPSLIVYKPTVAPILTTQPVEAPVLSPVVRARIEATDKPLNAKPEGAHVCEVDDRAVQEPRNFSMAPLNRPCYRPLVIGLYDGGAAYHCGVFHAGGICMMRSRTKGGEHRRFCHVCRYVLVDVIDPAQHGKLDAMYAKEYIH